ncbi:hypothetical protein [Shewanella pneumatophori]|uniref:Uncharacterized protein n=1 Tax=Shewanella pneumatophori TaxID=314092 RepID=A0A9X1ZI49_9GAMM|nr:hypothetical protein [Shewanella pneumatophori]MCL1140265.1 hypothetical protein [Shewanella pneumatophori]
MKNKIQLQETITNKEAQLSRARRESNTWSSGKYKTSSNAQVSKIFVQSLENEIDGLYKELSELENG